MHKFGRLLCGKKLILFLGFFLIFSILLFFFIQRSKPVVSAQVPVGVPEITQEELKKYNGTNPEMPIYIAFDGLIYDVTNGKKFYEPGGPYHDLAGKDSTAQLKLFGGDIIKRKYPVIGKLKI